MPDYKFEVDGFLTGDSQRVDIYLNSWVFETLVSSNFPVWNFYGSLGYVNGDANYALLGNYTIVTEQEEFNFSDPFDVQGEISGLRTSIGTTVRLNRFKLNLDYTFQGFNNLAFGLNYNLLKSK